MDTALPATSDATQAALRFNAANAAFREGRWEEALAGYGAALAMQANLDSAALQVARCLVQLERWMPAREAFATALRINPANYSAWLEAGHLCRRMGEAQQAMQCYQHAIGHCPQRFEAPLALARALESCGQLEQAQQAYDHALEAAAGQDAALVAKVHHHMGSYRLERGEAELALQSLQAAQQAMTSGNPAEPTDDAAELQMDIGECLLRLGRLEQAMPQLQGVSHSTREPALCRLSKILLRHNLWQQAISVARRNVELHPDSPVTRVQLVQLLSDCWQLEEAERELQQAELLTPIPGAKALRAAMASSRGDADAALALYQEAASEPALASALGSNIALTALYSDQLSAQQVAELHRQLFAPWGAGARSAGSFQRTPLAGRRIRLGLVSPDFFRQHPVNLFMQPVLRELDRSRFELFVYFTGNNRDEQTRLACERAEHWLEAVTLNNAQLAKAMDRDGLDIVLDLAGHTNAHHMALYAQRVAPVQVSYLGYPGSTGLPNMDWIIGDAVVTPPGQEELCTESVVRLPHCVFCYAPEADYPFPPYSQAHAQRPLTFGSFNNVAKLTPHTLSLWAQVLAAVPGSRLLLKAASLADTSAVAALGKRLQALGVDLGRVEFRGPSALAAMMAEYADVDIALDTVPYNGGTTTAQALWMGVPVIALQGNNFVSRMGTSIVSAAGLPDWVAEDDAGYVRIAVRQSGQRQALLALKQGLRQRLQTLPAWDVVRHTRALEDAIAQICTSNQAQSSASAATSGNSTSV